MKVCGHFVLFCTLVLSGCGIEPEAFESIREVVETASMTTTAEPFALQRPESESMQFDPPYPDRVDPFTFPSGTTIASDQPGTSILSAAQVDVMGFANVKEPRVFLRTKDTTKSLAVGDVVDGVEVIGIHPPAVDLRMGSLQWRATMFDKSAGAKP